MKGKQIGYVRVSSASQNEARQLVDVKLDKTFTDKVSGSTTNRPALEELIEFVREGDTVHVHSMDRLARNVNDLRGIVDGLISKGVTVHFQKGNLIFNGHDSAMSNLLLNIFGAIGEFEREIIRERQAEGIQQAKARGVYKGRSKQLTAEQITELKARAKSGESKAKLSREFGISRQSVYNYLG